MPLRAAWPESGNRFTCHPLATRFIILRSRLMARNRRRVGLMADVTEPTVCEACGRSLPPQQGKGRKRRYCNATCRSAARRSRESAPTVREEGVKGNLTSPDRNANLDSVNGGSGTADKIRAAALRLADELSSAGGSPLVAMAAARQLSAAANTAMQESVDRARAAGHSWREIGDVLETTRQAAFQRFGRPVDPRTGGPMLRAIPVGVADRAIALFTDIVAGRWEEASRDFTDHMREEVSPTRIANAYAQTISQVGAFERMGEPVAYPVALGTSVDILLRFEAGERTGQVTYDENGQVIGLFIRPPTP
jgi:hypothetical protein